MSHLNSTGQNSQCNLRFLLRQQAMEFILIFILLIFQTFKQGISLNFIISEFYKQMSSYIIAGSADSIDTAYCEQIARRIKAKYKNIDFRIVIKHPSEWEQYLQQICRIYGFLKKSNPIIYTFDGKIIGNKQAFMAATTKYFGLDQESLNVQNLTNEINMRIATEQINKKHIQKNSIKTLTQKIQSQYQNLLKKNILKHQLKQREQYLTNGIQYIHRSVKNMVPNISFTKNKQVKVQIQQIKVAEIDLMALSLNDQIKIQQVIAATTALPLPVQGKQAFVTTNQKNNSEHDRMSEISRTNKMHDSIVSHDMDSKLMKQSSKTQLRIDQEKDDVPDYIDQAMQQNVVVELSDSFFVGFNRNCHITGEMIFYHNEETNGNSLRIYNDNRPVKGHRVRIKQIYFDGQNSLLQQSPTQIIQQGTQQQGTLNQDNQDLQDQVQIKQQQTNQVNKQGNKTNLLDQPKKQVQQICSQPNIPQFHAPSAQNVINNGDVRLSQVKSDLNIISHLNYHTLYVLKPLSPIEIKNLLYFINGTDSIGCLQFLGENPNPKVKLYHRKLLLQTQKQDKLSLLLPIQKFIQKQLQDLEYTKIQVPNQKCYDYESNQNKEKFELIQINQIGYEHYIYMLNENTQAQAITKMLKYTIDSMFHLEQQLKKDVGYNLIFTKKYIVLVPLSQPYEIYNENKLYLDGLAYLGFIHTADVIRPYQLKRKQIYNMGCHIRKLLSICSNGSQQA